MSSRGVKPEYPDSSCVVEIGPRVWWIGDASEGDFFQCNTYLIEQGDNSVLIDLGTIKTFSNVLCKINDIIPFNSVKYFICHSPAPNIVGVLSLVEQLVFRQDAFIVTHSLAKLLLQHYNFRYPFLTVEDKNWALELEDRTLEFCFTPHAHFSGAFTTYDPLSKLMFTGGVFCGFPRQFTLFARDVSYVHWMKRYHQQYMPSNEIMSYALSAIKQYDIEMIAPQHGSLISKELLPFIFEKLRTLDCGFSHFSKK